MDFFAHQDSARRQTGILLALFAFSVALIIVAVYLSFCFVVPLIEIAGDAADSYDDAVGSDQALGFAWWRPKILLWSSLGTIVVVFLGCMIKIGELRGGGAVVATSLGGTLIMRESAGPEQQQLLNIVEEMAIASGVPVPPVYVMAHEESINAFAAGYTINDAVIGVSQGLIDRLNRDEIQGVIAHEYSHIFNGDMRLNIQLVGLLHGILLIAIIGYYCLRTASLSGRNSRGKNNPGIYLLFIGAAILVIGSVGLFFARLIKASVSRQREYLADASAVQFTRNPLGIAGALKKIAFHIEGSRIRSPEAESVSHLFFGDSKRRHFINLLATHPPLGDRISRLDPNWHNRSEPSGTPDILIEGNEASPVSSFSNTSASPEIDAAPKEQTASSIGSTPSEPTAPPTLSPLLREATVNAYTAQAAIFATLLSREADVRTVQSEAIKKACGPDVLTLAIRYARELTNRSEKLLLIDLANPSLKTLTPAQYGLLLGTTGALIEADSQMDLFEFMLHRILISRDPHHCRGKFRSRYRSYRPIKPSIATIIASCIHASGIPEDEAGAVIEQALTQEFPSGRAVPTPERNAITLSSLGNAIDDVAQASDPIKRKVVGVVEKMASADHKISTNEAQIIRALAASCGVSVQPYYGDR